MEDPNKIKETLVAASQLLDKEEFSAAAKAYQAILDSGTTTTEVHLGLAKSLYGAKKYDEAAKVFQAILDSGTTTAEVNLGLAKSLYGAERYDEAAKAFKEILDSEIKDPGIKEKEVNRWLGHSLLQLWKYDDAIPAFEAAIKIEPDPVTHNDLGELFYQLRRFEEAIQNFMEAAKLSRAEADQAKAKAKAKADAAAQCSDEEKKKDAQKMGEKAQEAIEEYADRCIDLGYCYLALRNYDTAEAYLAEAIKYAGYYPLAYHALASVYWTQGNYDVAITEWQRAKERYQQCEAKTLEKGWPGWLVYAGTLLHEVFGDLDEAERVYKAALVLGGDSIECRVGLTALYRERQENDPKKRNKAATEAQRNYQKAKAIIKSKNHTDVESLLMVGELDLLMEDYDSAKISLTMALSKDEEQKANKNYVNTAKPRTDLGILCMRTNRCKEAIKHFEMALTTDRTDLALRSNLAEAYLRDDRLVDAEKEFLRVLKIAPHHIESRIGLAAVYSAMGDTGDSDMYEAAITQYTEALMLAERKSGSKRLKASELAKVRYSRGYAYVKSYEVAATSRERRRLHDARGDFLECFKLDCDQHKAKRAIEKIDKVLPRRSPQRYIEEWGPSLILMLSFLVFLAFQLRLPSWLNFLGPAQPVPASEYITVTLGSLLLMVASCYLPQLLKLKVPGIELEKTAVDQITTLGPVGISKPT